jgi:hypothetical protein
LQAAPAAVKVRSATAWVALRVGGYHSPVHRAALAALTFLLVACSAAPAPVASTSQAASQSRTGPIISPPPVTPPTAPGDNTTVFACKDTSGGATGTSNVTAVRAGEEASFDRFVLQFDSKVPAYTVKRQAKATFTQGASGQTMTLVGSFGVLITLKATNQSGSYTGPTDITHPEFAILKEARVVQDFEGTVQWGIGLASPVCMRAFTLSDPARLVIDFSTTS